MRLLFKLAALAVLTVLFQLSIEVCVALTTYPTDPTAGYFGGAQTEAVLAAERRFQHCSRLSRWIVKDLIDMPLAEPLVSSVGLPPTR